jgi:hypothetical protein
MTLLPPQDLYSEILPGLWQGGTHDFATLEFPKEYPIWKSEKLFDSVATLYAAAHPVGWGVTERRYGFTDSALSEKISLEFIPWPIGPMGNGRLARRFLFVVRLTGIVQG